MTLLALFRWWSLIRSLAFLLWFDLVDRSVAFYVAAEIKDEAILLVRVYAETATDALIEQAGRHGWAEHYDAIDPWCVKTSRENIDVAEKTKRFGFK